MESYSTTNVEKKNDRLIFSLQIFVFFCIGIINIVDFDRSHDAVRWMALSMMELGNMDEKEVTGR